MSGQARPLNTHTWPPLLWSISQPSHGQQASLDVQHQQPLGQLVCGSAVAAATACIASATPLARVPTFQPRFFIADARMKW